MSNALKISLFSLSSLAVVLASPAIARANELLDPPIWSLNWTQNVPQTYEIHRPLECNAFLTSYYGKVLNNGVEVRSDTVPCGAYGPGATNLITFNFADLGTNQSQELGLYNADNDVVFDFINLPDAWNVTAPLPSGYAASTTAAIKVSGESIFNAFLTNLPAIVAVISAWLILRWFLYWLKNKISPEPW